ncbi:MAG: hypothetical protein J5760_07115, partial [Clostridia bacterium]|nr:hypothetical protein [Clostridia bacterium]
LAESSGYKEWINRYLDSETRDEAEKEFFEKYLPGFEGKLDQLPFIWPFIRMCRLNAAQVEAAYDPAKNAYYKSLIDKTHYALQYTILFPQEISILCSNNVEDIMKYLKADSTFYYKGKLYNLYEIKDLSEKELKEMANDSNLTAFLENTVQYLREYGKYCDWIIEKTEQVIKVLRGW